MMTPDDVIDALEMVIPGGNRLETEFDHVARVEKVGTFIGESLKITMNDGSWFMLSVVATGGNNGSDC